MNLPGVVVDLPTLTKKDEDDLVNWGLPNDIDFIAASFVRKGLDLDNIRKVCLLMNLHLPGCTPTRLSLRFADSRPPAPTIALQMTCREAL